MRVLVADPIAADGIALLRKQVEVDVRTGLAEETLVGVIGQYAGLVVRSETQVTARLIEAGARLTVVGRAGVGVDNIDVAAATRRGIVVVNAPAASTVAAAEHTVALLLSLARQVPQAHCSLKSGEWQRRRFVGVEVRGKVLGLVGLGKIGAAVAKRAQGLEMRVVAYDPFVAVDYARSLGVELAPLDDVLRQADFISVHTPLTAATRGLVGERELRLVKPSLRLINVARGEIVDEEALRQALAEGRLAGAALDVFSREPAVGNPLLQSDRVIATPHLGGSTAEAQVGVAVDVAEQVLAVLAGRPARYAVNAPFISPDIVPLVGPFLVLADKLGRIATQVASGQLREIGVACFGEIAEHDTTAIKAAALRGVLAPVAEEPVNLVNAAHLARSRGLRVAEEKSTAAEQYASLVRLRLATDDGTTTVSGTVLGGGPHLVQVDDYWVNVLLNNGHLLLIHHQDRPGVVGAVGTVLGRAGVNISFMQVGRLQAGGRAIMVLGLDEPVEEREQRAILSVADVYSARVVKL